jgi:hypothetical protein
MRLIRSRAQSKGGHDVPNGANDSSSNTTNKAAWIGAAATISAALIAGIFALVNAGSTSTPPTTTTTNPFKGVETSGLISITSVSFKSGSAGEIISVSGVASQLGQNAELYAVARPSAKKAGTWLVSSGVKPGSDGRWATAIRMPAVSSVPYTVSVVDVPTTPHVACPSDEACSPAPIDPTEQLAQFGPGVGTGTTKSEPATVTP